MRTGQRMMILAVLAAGGLSGFGCGRNGPRTHPVNGRIEVRGGEVAALAGSHVEAALEADPSVRASGEIQSDGNFTLTTLYSGSLLPGAVEGTYQVRLLLADDDQAALYRAAMLVPRRYLDFRSSGWTLQVPSEEVLIRVNRP